MTDSGKDLTIERVRGLVDEIRNFVPNLRVIEERPTEQWRATRFQFVTSGSDEPTVTIASGGDALDVHLGHGLILEHAARNEEEAESAVASASSLVHHIARNGFTEKLWLRQGCVVKAEAEVPVGDRMERLARRGLQRLRGIQAVDFVHPPWR